MITKILAKIIGTKNERELKKIAPIVERINSLESQFKDRPLSELREWTDKFRKRLEESLKAQGVLLDTKTGRLEWEDPESVPEEERKVARKSRIMALVDEALDEILPEAFALVREVARQTVKMRHFDVQLIGGIVLHQGKIAEMKTGEGKTLVATLPVYLNALLGKGVHVVTVNDYLAKRDAEWMGPIYRALGLSVGAIVHELSDEERRKAYHSDVTYGTNNEFGFDYLRDNMKLRIEDMVQRELFYAIVDEVDSILIDEARTPLIISGPAEESTDKYYIIDKAVRKLQKGKHYVLDEKEKHVMLTDEGIAKMEELLGVENLYAPYNIEILHHVEQALKAHALFKRDVDYVVKDGKVIIVDEFTGRLMPGRRYSDGLHQALEAKENVVIERENQTLATISFQNYFKMYAKLAGMTGTAATEGPEFKHTYDLEVVVIPTHKPMIRKDYPDVVYKTEAAKFNAVIKEIEDCYARGQPVLVGTTSIEKNEKLASMLKKRGIPHQILNAKHHEKEAMIIAQAGRYKAVTVATNMAGRGVDIILGGNPELLAKQEIIEKFGSLEDAPEEEKKRIYEEVYKRHKEEQKKVIEVGGLHIIGTERHEARRIDNQLRGRSGRQGDPGSSRFFLSLEDDLMRIFGGERIKKLMDILKVDENMPIEHKLVSKAIENAQARVEAYHFEIRKRLLDYDNVMNLQREAIYKQRREIMASEDVSDMVRSMIDEVAEATVQDFASEDKYPEEWNWDGLKDALKSKFGIELDIPKDEYPSTTYDALLDKVFELVEKKYEEKKGMFVEIGANFLEIQKWILLRTVDDLWKDHLLALDHLRQGIGLRGYGQRDPLNEYKREAYQMFDEMVWRIKEDVATRVMRIQPAPTAESEARRPKWVATRQPRKLIYIGAGEAKGFVPAGQSPQVAQAVPRQPESQKLQAQAAAGVSRPMFSRRAPEPPQEENVEKPQTYRRATPKVGRNDPCPCGSGKKYKYCCGRE